MLTVEQYGVSYQQIYSWVRKYELKGIEGLADGRGRTKPESEMTDTEKLQAQVRMLEAQLRDKQMTIAINRIHHIAFNKKRIRRLMRALQLQSVCRKKRYNYTPSTPEVPAENILNRNFHADKPNEKWLTDVTEFKWYEGPVVHKLYLSAILDLYDRRIVAYKIGVSNNRLVLDTFDEAVKTNPDAHPLFHSDREFQYTSTLFRAKLEKAGMTQSMSRAGRCIDNGPMEGFLGILKSEMYYLRKFTDEQELISAIENYIHFYNTRRYQRRLKCMTPIKFHNAA
ncbi:MAG: IS3 family transposase [Oscillospiraceae bacterium]|nr:IS3 family transposase [Oscillospiraceae bacterium]